jgi:hypothetical protein
MSIKRLRKHSLKETGENFSFHGRGENYWNHLPWKAVDTSDLNFAFAEEAVFFGLEELDGDAFIKQKEQLQQSKSSLNIRKENKTIKEGKKESNKNNNNLLATSEKLADNDSSENTDKMIISEENPLKTNKSKKKRKLLAISDSPAAEETENDQCNDDHPLDHPQPLPLKVHKKNQPSPKNPKPVNLTIPINLEPWGHCNNSNNNNNINKSDLVSETPPTTPSLLHPILLPACLSKGLEACDYLQATKIQQNAIPKILVGSSDIVGIAETGSGKTLVRYLLYLILFILIFLLYNIYIYIYYILY